MRELHCDRPGPDSGAGEDHPPAGDQHQDPGHPQHLHRVPPPARGQQHEAQPGRGERPAEAGGGRLHQHPGERQGGLHVQEPRVPQEGEQEQEPGPGAQEVHLLCEQHKLPHGQEELRDQVRAGAAQH